MISYIQGKLFHKTTNYLTVLTSSGVGYKIYSTNNVVSQYNISDSIALFIYSNIKENDISLFGFKESEELEFFEKLISVSGIGPKIALDILGSPIKLISRAIIEKDIPTLTKIKGLGKKTAERLVLELKNKVDIDLSSETETNNIEPRIKDDVIEALSALGYERYIIHKTLETAPNEVFEDSEEMIKWFLKTA